MVVIWRAVAFSGRGRHLGEGNEAPMVYPSGTNWGHAPSTARTEIRASRWHRVSTARALRDQPFLAVGTELPMRFELLLASCALAHEVTQGPELPQQRLPTVLARRPVLCLACHGSSPALQSLSQEECSLLTYSVLPAAFAACPLSSHPRKLHAA